MTSPPGRARPRLPHPHTAAVLTGTVLLGVGGLAAPRPGAIPSAWPPPWALAWHLALLAAAALVAAGMLCPPGDVTGWLVQRAGFVALGGLDIAYAIAAATGLGWHAIDAAGVIGSIGLAHWWLARRMGRDLTDARTATTPDHAGGS